MADRLCTSVRPYKKGQSPIFGYFLPGTSTGGVTGGSMGGSGTGSASQCAFTTPG